MYGISRLLESRNRTRLPEDIPPGVNRRQIRADKADATLCLGDPVVDEPFAGQAGESFGIAHGVVRAAENPVPDCQRADFDW